MRVLVTGGAGYIGSHAVRKLINKGHQVVVVDDLSKGYRAAVHEKAIFIQGNAGDTKRMATTLLEHRVDAVMHFAAFIEVGESVKDPERYYRNNFVNGLGLLDALRKASVSRFVFSSTAAVYGNPAVSPIDENAQLQPINPYGRSKLMMEQAIADFSAAYGLGYTILRYFNVAGASSDSTIGEAHEPESHLIPRVLRAATRGSEPVQVFGQDYPTQDGTCIRDYIHVEDLIDAHLLALESIKPGGGAVYNLGSERGFSVFEVIDACRKVSKAAIPARVTERRPGDPPRLVAASGRIRSALGWSPAYPDLETIVRHAWNWHVAKPKGFG